MTFRLQQFGYRESPYERPNQKWVCGWTAEGNPCHVGPDGKGRCPARAQAECTPRRGDPSRGESEARFYCTRPEVFGGTCDDGPNPDGTCCHPEPAQPVCQPRLSLRAYRGRITMWCTLVTIGLIIAVGFGPWGNAAITPGPLSSPHAIIEQTRGVNESCAACHRDDPVAGPMFQPISDSACLECHIAEAHYPQHSAGDPHMVSLADRTGQIAMAQGCAKCHDEHLGRDHQLSMLSDHVCTNCHQNLTPHLKADYTSRTVTQLTDFAGDHPDWRLVRNESMDATPIRFEHHVHLDPSTEQMQDRIRRWLDEAEKAGIPSAGMPVRQRDGQMTLTCSACHEPDSAGLYMKPIRFERHCQQCHNLGTREGENVPHGSLIGDFIERVAAKQIQTPPTKPGGRRGGPPNRPGPPSRGGPPKKPGPPSKPGPPGPPRGGPPSAGGSSDTGLGIESEADFAKQVVERAEKNASKLSRSIALECSKCHEPNVDPVAIPDPRIPERWLTHSRFNHSTHELLDCTECHNQATADAEETDWSSTPLAESADKLSWTGRTKQIMMPSIDLCRRCHAPKRQITTTLSSTAARHECVTCHRFHKPPVTRDLVLDPNIITGR